MNKTTKIVLISIIGIVIIGGGAYFLMNNRKDDKNTSQRNGTANQDSSDKGSTSAPTITYTNSGFEPNTLTVQAGTTITIKNDSSEDLQFSSDDHPTHTQNTELNETTLGPDQTQTLTLTQTGTWGYHNHIDPSDTGTIIVE